MDPFSLLTPLSHTFTTHPSQLPNPITLYLTYIWKPHVHPTGEAHIIFSYTHTSTTLTAPTQTLPFEICDRRDSSCRFGYTVQSSPFASVEVICSSSFAPLAGTHGNAEAGWNGLPQFWRQFYAPNDHLRAAGAAGGGLPGNGDIAGLEQSTATFHLPLQLNVPSGRVVTVSSRLAHDFAKAETRCYMQLTTVEAVPVVQGNVLEVGFQGGLGRGLGLPAGVGLSNLSLHLQNSGNWNVGAGGSGFGQGVPGIRPNHDTGKIEVVVRHDFFANRVSDVMLTSERVYMAGPWEVQQSG